MLSFCFFLHVLLLFVLHIFVHILILLHPRLVLDDLITYL